MVIVPPLQHPKITNKIFWKNKEKVKEIFKIQFQSCKVCTVSSWGKNRGESAWTKESKRLGRGKEAMDKGGGGIEALINQLILGKAQWKRLSIVIFIL